MNRPLWPALLVAALTSIACTSTTPVGDGFSSPSPSGWPSTDNRLTGIACADAMDCVAVGYLAPGYAATGVNNRTLIEQSTEGRWQIAVSPNAAGAAGSALSGVACPTAHDCIAVGDSQDSEAAPTALIEQNTGSGWAIVSSPRVAGSLAAVACAAPDYCVAVGRNEASGRSVIEENRGSGWAPVPSGDANVAGDFWLSRVSCPSRNFCVAVGGSSLTPERSLPLIETSSGSGWQIVRVAGESELLGVACPSTSMCVATGSETYVENYPNLVAHNLIEELTQGSWAPITPPAGDIGLIGPVACAGSGYCMTVDAYGASDPEVLVRTGGGWAVGPGGELSNKVERLLDVTCVDATTCLAVGDQWLGGPADYINPRATFVVEHTGQGWTVQESPNA